MIPFNRFARHSLHVFLLYCVAGFSVHASDLTDDTGQAVREFENYLAENVLPYVPGAAVVVVAQGQVRLLQAYGMRETGGHEPVDPDTVFRLASVSKTFASAAAGLLVNDNQVSWDTPIVSRVKQITFKDPELGSKITLQNVLSQTTGLVPHAFTNLIEDNVRYQSILGRLNEVDFVCPPGTCYTYQNVAYSLSGDFIESVSGKAYEEFVAERLFQPLHMDDASFGLDAFKASDNKATPHVRRRQQWNPVAVKPTYYRVAPAAGVNASISDMGEWLQAQLGQRQDILPEQVLDSLHSRAVSTTRRQAHYKRQDGISNTAYGLGWRIFDFAEHKNFIHHSGWVQGTLADMVFNRELQLGMVFLTNAESPDTTDLIFKFLDAFLNNEQLIETQELSMNSTGEIQSVSEAVK